MNTDLIMAAFENELEKISGSLGLKRQLRLGEARQRLGERLMELPFKSRPKADLDRWDALLQKERKLNKRNVLRSRAIGGRQDPRG